MKKLAIFVEGQTEQIFIDKFLREFITNSNLIIESEKASGGKKCPRFTTVIAHEVPTPETKYEILLFNSCNDIRVLSDLRDRYENLKINGYIKFIAIRDLYPDYTYLEKDEAIEEASFFIKGFENTIIIYATMEVETWFLAELNHYEKIDKDLTLEKIKTHIDLKNIVNFERDILHPADTLNNIYQLVTNRHWTKSEKQIKRTVKALDYENLYLNTKEKVPSLKELIDSLDEFFSE